MIETKGMHLGGSEDTEYKKALFDTCNELAKETTLSQLGLKLHAQDVCFAVVPEIEWERRFNELFA